LRSACAEPGVDNGRSGPKALMRIADRCLVMSAGVLRWSGAMQDGMASEAIREAYFA
jgi:ABC-type branched-subunit amino acid transport system ATPase component